MCNEHNSSLAYQGGSVSGNLVAAGNRLVTYSGGTILGSLQCLDNGTIDLLGTNLAFKPAQPVMGFMHYLLSGKLVDGTSLDGKSLYAADGSSCNLEFNGVIATAVPEPGSVALLVGMAGVGVGLLRKRRQ